MLYSTSDTIAAIATATGNAGIGIIRISGAEAWQIADLIFVSPTHKKILNQSTHTIHYGIIKDGDQVIDEVLVMLMKAPHSYTAEDTVEINCHGGMLITRRILETVLRHGARAAEPGEFTKRAFFNGRIDLAQAEAVKDLINSQSEYARISSISQLGGSISRKISAVRKTILNQIARIESALDDPEHLSLDHYGETLWKSMIPVCKELTDLIDSFEEGKVMTEGIKTVIMGKPNTGKSSLLNVLSGEEKAIVTEIAGTTRDTLEQQIILEGIRLRMIDTAGIHETEDVIEKIGVERALTASEDADLILFLLDSSRPLDENDEKIFNMTENRKVIILLNKSDLPPVISQEEIERKTRHPVISISAREETGLKELGEEIANEFYHGKINLNDEVIITNLRHKTALKDALESLLMVKKSIEDQMPEDFFSIDLMNAYERLGSITGEAVEDDLVNEIFSSFCMGK